MAQLTIDLVFESRWRSLMADMEKRFGMPTDLDGMLFLIGVQELGQHGRIFTKDEKIGLMHIAIAVVLGPYGYYAPAGRDADGWPHFNKLRELPGLKAEEQERLLKQAILEYFGR